MHKKLSLAARAKGKQSGQGLVEYALILVLVAIVVTVILVLFGPAINSAYNTVIAGISASGGGGAAPTSTAPAPTATTPAWTFCASENQTCAIPAGPRTVRYGANGTYTTQSYIGPQNVSCNNATFGDPLQGVVKHCDYQ